MARKLLAVVFAVTLMAGTAWSATTTDYVWEGGKWVKLDGTANDPTFPSGTIEVGNTNNLYFSNVTDTARSGSIGDITVGGSTSGILGIGSASAAYTGGGGSVTPAGPVSITADSITSGGDKATINIAADSTLKVTGILKLNDNASNVLTNAGTLEMGELDSGTAAKIVNTGELTLNGDGAAALATALAAGTPADIGIVNLNGTVTAFNTAAATINSGIVNIAAQTAAVVGIIDVDGATLNLAGGEFTGAVTAKIINTADGSVTSFADVVTSSTGITTGAGSTIAFTKGFGATTIGTGGTLKILAGDTPTANGNITMGANSTLSLDKVLAMNSKTLDMASTTKLSVGDTLVAATSGDLITGFSGVSSLKVNGTGLADNTAATAYLDTLERVGLTKTASFAWATNKITYTIAATADSAAAMTGVLNDTGSGHMASGLTASAIDAWAETITTHAATPYTGQGVITADLMNRYFNPIGDFTPGAEEMQSVVSTLAGYDSAKSLDIAMVTANNVTGRINARVADNNLARAQTNLGSSDALASAMLNCSFANRFWVGGFGVWENADRSGWDNGYEYKSGGFITGYDRVFGPVTVGGSFAYTAGSYEDKNALSSDSSIDSYAFNLYATYNHCSGFFATILGGYTYSDYDMSNVLAGGVEKSAFHADTWMVGGTVGYDIRPLQNLTITPSIGLYYYTSKSNTYNSTMKNGLKVEQDSAEMPIDLAASYDIPVSCGNIRLTANTGYAYRFGNAGGNLNDFGYNGITGVRVEGIEGRENPRHTWNVGAGVSYSTGRFDIGVKYDYYLKKNYDAHRVLGTVGISF